MLISVARTNVSSIGLFTASVRRNAFVGLLSGALFGLAAISYRAASLALGGPNFLMQASLTLAFVIVLQSFLLLAWMFLREPGQFELVRERGSHLFWSELLAPARRWAGSWQ